MQLIILAVIVGATCLTAIVIYAIRSGLADAQDEVKAQRQRADVAEAKLGIARRGLYEVAGNQTDNTIGTAIATLDAVENYSPKELHK